MDNLTGLTNYLTFQGNMKTLRYYQAEAVESIKTFKGYGGLIVLPTGSGKSLVAAEICKNPDKKILVLAHRAELIKQNAEEFQELTGELPGIWAASLNERTERRVTFAMITSAYRRGFDVDLIIVDEAHLIPSRETSMYQQLLESSNAKQLIGLTATEHRTDIGHLVQGDKSLFSKVIYKAPYDKLVDEGYLAGIKYKSGVGINNSDINLKNGELDQLVASNNLQPKLASILIDATLKRKGRTLWFCPTVQMADHVALLVGGKSITGTTPNRDLILNDFKSGKVKDITNVEVLTTGFNEPKIETIVFLRPTQSTALFKQMLGRGTRLSEGKTNCLVLDYTTNTECHGFLGDDNYPNAKGVSPEYKCCLMCEEVIKVREKICPECGYEWESVPQGERRPLDNLKTVSHDPDQEYVLDLQDMTAVSYRSMKSNKNTIQIIFKVNGGKFSKWIPQRGFFTNQFLGKLEIDRNFLVTPEAKIAAINNCNLPKRVLAKKKGKYFDFVDFV